MKSDLKIGYIQSYLKASSRLKPKASFFSQNHARFFVKSASSRSDPTQLMLSSGYASVSLEKFRFQ